MRKCSWDRRLQGLLCGRFLCGLAVQHRDMRTRLQLVLPVNHDLLVGLESGINERLAIADLRDLYRADCHRVVGIDDVGVGSLRALLHDGCGNGQAVMPDINK